MSRIVIERHPNGEEKLTAGYDRPESSFFVDLYDDEGEYVRGIGLLGSMPCPDPETAAQWLVEQGVGQATASRVQTLLSEHTALEYPESNVVVDLSDRRRA